MEKKKRYFEAYTQIIILIVATIAFSYIAHESSIQNKIGIEEKTNELSDIVLSLLRIINKIIWNEKTIVSALGEDILQTCPQTCFEYLSGQCAANCAVACIPTRAADIAECKIGTCYSQTEGTCASGAHKKTCEALGGIWKETPGPECNKGCCLNRNNAIFETERACTRNAELGGIDENFRSEINTESACLISGAASEESGACLLGRDTITEKYDCKFKTRSECNSLHGDFHTGALCSNSDLNTKCERQSTTSCLNGKAEIYWFDSCGNRENIYDANKEASWNNGMVLSKSESCSLGDNLANQGTCGNCNYLAGNTCRPKTSAEKLDDGTQNVVCKDLSCIDEKGVRRAHGESWCEYQGAIGVEGGRAVDTPGSSHFRKVCAYGEIRTEPCQSGREEICVESKTQSGGKSFSSAVCRINSYTECMNYDSAECANNPDCFVKDVNLGKNFQFSTCVAKDPPGSGDFCSLGTKSCTAVFVKKLKGVRKVWMCVANCDCLKQTFMQQMNDLCMSLGDCGAEVNYVGDLTTGGAAFSGRAVGFWQGYLDGLRTHANSIPGKTIDAGDINQVNSYWIPSSINTQGEFGGALNATSLSWLEGTAKISGAAGILYFGAANLGVFSATTPFLGSLASHFGAAAGLAATYYLIRWAKIGPGLPSGLVWTLLAAGYTAGGLLGYSFTYGSESQLLGITSGPVGWIILALVVLFTLIFKGLGIGQTKEKTATFTCQPWQAPRGGASCDKCGKDGFPCSAYACQSLGSACTFINEGTRDQECVATNINDVIPPIISPVSLSESYHFVNPSDLGVQLRSSDGDGCIGAYSSVKFEIDLDKPGKCRYSSSPFDNPAPVINAEGDIEFSEEEFANFVSGDINYFSNGIIKKNHSTTITIPSAESLGLEAYKPDESTDYNIYIRCENVNGHEASRDYLINMCAKPGRDLTPPLITISEPQGNFIKYGSTEQNLKIFTNEPANCSWSSGEMNYDSMINKMNCNNDFGEQTAFGWACNSTLPITANENKFYIRCADKPWNESDSNKNSQSTPLTLTKTSKLEITSAKPDNETLVFGTPIVSVNVEARTSGGLSGGPTCLASFDGVNYYVILSTTDGATHRVMLPAIDSGPKKIWLKCEDRVGNVAYKNLSFNVEIDTDAPKITRVYYGIGGLVIKTDEPADCALSLDKCSFNFVNGTAMSGSDFTHSSSVEKNKVYYAKCKDKLGNVAGMCDSQFKVVY